MSDNIPFEIQMEIIHRIPDTKSLIQYRSVSKAWKSVIDSKDFVASHTLRHTRDPHHHLLIRTQDTQVKYVSIVDDDTFPHRKLSVFVPDAVHKFNDSIIVGSSHGLFCLYERETSTAVIWNPSIGKIVATKVPNVLRERTVVGFGICPCGLDPKLVKIGTQVEVFTLSSGGTWRSPLSSNLPHKSIEFGHSQAVVDGFIYWRAINVDAKFWNQNLIMSFDLISEEFTEINLPGRLAPNRHVHMLVSNLRESLAVLVFDRYNHREICDVWMMTGHGCTRSFNRLYSIYEPDASVITTLGFRKSGAPIIEVDEDREEFYFKTDSLAIYEPESKNITNIGIHGLKGTFFVHSYMETLLLLGH